jgi:tRNA 2-thiouridine synthesizing protein A
VTAAADPVTVDARGMRCPWPVVRLARAMRAGASAVRLVADDPRAYPDAQILAGEMGWSAVEEGGALVIRALPRSGGPGAAVMSPCQPSG